MAEIFNFPPEVPLATFVKLLHDEFFNNNNYKILF